MEKVYFDDDKECKEFFDNNMETHDDDHDDSVLRAVCNCHIHGHIKKSDLEIAREKWEEIKHDIDIDFSGEYKRNLNFANEYIELLKQELEAKK